MGGGNAEPYRAPGIAAMELLSDSPAIVPGEALTLGLIISPEAGHHTYWRGPGIVGVATSISWELPEGFEPGPLLWPAPEKVDMAGITANGYRGQTILLTEIRIPETLPGKTFTLRARVAWMSCATTCNPGVTDFTLTLPAATPGTSVSEIPATSAIRKQFQSVRASIPGAAPDEWTARISRPDKHTIALTLTIPGLDPDHTDGIRFFCDDMQVNSDKPTHFSWIDPATGTFALRFTRPDFAPKNPPRFSGVLQSPVPWPSLDTGNVEISVPWPEESFRDE